MVRCTLIFILISLIVSLSLSHPVGIENVEEIIEETVGIQAVEDDLFDILETDGVQEEIENKVTVVIGPPYVITEDESTAGIQAIEDEEEDVIAGIQGVEDKIDIQVVEKDVIEEDVGIQGIEDDEDEAVFEIQAVEDVTKTQPVESITDAPVNQAVDVAEDVIDNVIAQTFDDHLEDGDINMEFELFEENEETTTSSVENKTVPVEEDDNEEQIGVAAVFEDETIEEEPEDITDVGIIEDKILPVQNTEETPTGIVENSESASAFKKLAEDTLNKLKFLHIFDSNTNIDAKRHNERDSDSESSDSDSDNDITDEPQQTESIFVINETEVFVNELVTESNIISEVETDVPIEEINTNVFDEIVTDFVSEHVDPIENVTPSILNNNEYKDDDSRIPNIQKKQEDDDDLIEIALYEIDDDIEKNSFEIMTEIVTDVHDVPTITDEDQPTIGSIDIEENNDEDINEDINEDIPLFGVVVEIDEEVAIAGVDEDPQIDKTYYINSILIDISEESDAVETDAATDAIDEEPSIIN